MGRGGIYAAPTGFDETRIGGKSEIRNPKFPGGEREVTQ